MTGYYVTLVNQGQRFWLRGTVWSWEKLRGQTYQTQEQAQAALDRAKPFMKAAVYKRAVIERFTA